MSARASALVLRRRQRQLTALQLRMDAACDRIRRLADANVRLRETSTGLVRLLSVVAGGGDPEQPSHGERTARLAVRLGRQVGLAPAEVDDLRLAALLHDVGRAHGDAEAPEGHAERAAKMVESLPFPAGVAEAIRCHHDRWDGRGNRSGLRGDAIPMLARVLAVADAFDELVAGAGLQSIDAAQAARVVRGTASRVHDPAIVEALGAMVAEDEKTGRLQEADAPAGATA